MVYAFGGAAEYKGKDLMAAHYHLVTQHGLNLDHFDMVAGHFQATLTDLKVAQVRVDSPLCCCHRHWFWSVVVYCKDADQGRCTGSAVLYRVQHLIHDFILLLCCFVALCRL